MHGCAKLVKLRRDTRNSTAPESAEYVCLFGSSNCAAFTSCDVGCDRFGRGDRCSLVGGLALAGSNLDAFLAGDSAGAGGLFVFGLVGGGYTVDP